LVSPYINRFLQPDTIIPNPSNPQSWNRYSYVANRPINFNDPTGHSPCEEYQGVCLSESQMDGVWDSLTSGGGGGAGGGGGDGHSGGGHHHDNDLEDDLDGGMTIPFDTDEIVNSIPGTSQQWSTIASAADEIALAWDILLGVYVLVWAGIGLGGGLMFEGNPVTGLAGAAAGFIIGEGSVFMSGALFPGNIIASAATVAGSIADAKSGNTSIAGQLSISQNGINLTANGQVASTTVISTALSAVGWPANIVSISLPLQLAAVENDRGTFGSFNLPVDINITFP